jgi:hypothetical protein
VPDTSVHSSRPSSVSTARTLGGMEEVVIGA